MPQNTESLITEAKNYFSKKISESNANNYKASRQKVSKTPLWDNAGIINFKRGKTVIVPLKFDKDIHFQSSFGDSNKISLERQSYLFMYKGSNSRFKTEVVMYFPDKEFLEHRTSGFSGVVKVENWEGSAVNTFLFKDNKTYKFKSRAEVTSNKSNLKTSAEICYYINWYDCEELSPGSYYNCQFIGSDFLGCYEEDLQEEISWINDDPLGGSGNYYIDDPCVQIEKDNFNKESQGGSVASELLSTTISIIDGFKKHKDPTWKCFKGFGGWELISQEIGIIELVDVDDDIWHWKSLSHGGISMSGSTLPGVSVSYNQGIGTPSVSTLYAGMSLNFSVSYSFVCNCPNFPLIGWIPPVNKNYTATSTLWNSNPN